MNTSTIQKKFNQILDSIPSDPKWEKLAEILGEGLREKLKEPNTSEKLKLCLTKLKR